MDNTTASLIALLVVAAILIFFVVWGFHKGFLRLVLTTMAFVVTIVVAGLLAPKLSHVVHDSFIGKSIEEGIGKYVDEHMGSAVTETSKEIQDQIIEKLPLPSIVQKELSAGNNAEGYLETQAKSFTDYLKNQLSGLAINIATYLLLLILVYLVIRILLRVFKVLNNIPVIGGINRFLGAVVGLAEGLLLVWVVCLIIMALGGTDFGRQALKVIEGNPVLKFFYEHNGIIMGANALFHTFL